MPNHEPANTPPEAPLLSALRQRLGEIKALAASDDVLPTRQAEQRLRGHFRDMLKADPDTPVPHIGMIPDGCLYIEWRRGLRFLALVAYPDGRLKQYARDIRDRTSRMGALVSEPDVADTAAAIEWLAGPDGITHGSV